jgi:hypothetical protein
LVDLIRAAAALQARLDQLALPNCVIGGLAVQAWGEVRTTRDADFTVLTRFVDEEEKAREIFRLITPRRPDALPFGLQNRVLLGYMEGDIAVDLGMGGFEFEESVVARAVSVELAPSVWLRVCSAEDLVIMKTFAGRDRDWDDIRGVIERQAELDWGYIESGLPELLELAEAPERMDRLLRMRSE